MQRELLIHRFGFHSNDIVTLTDADASRRNILEHFEEFLINPYSSVASSITFKYASATAYLNIPRGTLENSIVLNFHQLSGKQGIIPTTSSQVPDVERIGKV